MATPTIDAGASATIDQSTVMRRGSSATVAASPKKSATQEPRENDRYSATTKSGTDAPPATANDARRECATTPTARITPIAVSNPKAFQYPSGSASRVALNRSIEASNRSGKSLVASP